MTEPVWHLARQGQQFGPYTWPQIQMMAREGHIQPGDLLWGPSLPQWTPAGRIQGLALPPPAAPPSPRPAVGAPVPPPAAPAYPPPAPPPAPVPPRTPPPVAPAPAPPAAGFAPSPAAPKRGDRSCLVIGIILLALALLAGGVAALLWWAPWQDASGGAGGTGGGDTWTEPAAAEFPTAPAVPRETQPESSGSVELGAGRTGVALGDGTSVDFPALPHGDSLRLTLERRTNDITLDVEGLQTTGSLRVVTVDAASLASPDAAAVCAPVITIPAKEAGAIAPGSLLLARLGDVRLGDEVQSGRLDFLPLRQQLDGRYAARDPFFPLLPVFQSPPAARTPAPAPSPLRAMLRPPGGSGRVLALGFFMPDLLAAPAASPTARANAIQYAVVTYQGSINWRREPQLVRMAPTWGKPERRQPLSQLSNLQREIELAKPVHNVFVLVHGRNEMEKSGLGTAPQIGAPWWYGYKRDVWTHLYEIYLKDHKERLNSTVFFEFIYPSFRPVFQGDGPTAEYFDRLVRQQLKRQLDLKYPFNLFIVAHSMGGIVSRAGVQRFDGDLDGNFRHLATWGTPHLGSPLVSLNYALTLPYYVLELGKDIDPAQQVNAPTPLPNTLPPTKISVGADWRRTLFGGVLITDNPGTMDLRWTLGMPGYTSELALDRIGFTYDQAYIEKQFESMEKAAPYVNLRSGSHLYSQNLRQLNERDKYAGSDRYIFLYGVTAKGVKLNLSADWGDLYYQVTTLPKQTEIGFGATALWVLVDNPGQQYRGADLGDGDGASTVLSMTGHDLAGQVVNLGEADHEEYFGAPDAPGHFQLGGKATATARRTLAELGFGSDPRCDPPVARLEVARAEDLAEVLRGDRDGWLAVRGRLEWPGDPAAHRRIDPKKVEAFAFLSGAQSREPVEARGLTVRSGGEFEAELFVKDLRDAGLEPKGSLAACVRLFFGDGTALESEPVALAGDSGLLGLWVGTALVTEMNRDFILNKNLEAATDEVSAARASIIRHANKNRLYGFDYFKVKEPHKLNFMFERTDTNPAEAKLMEGKYYVQCSYFDLRLLPQFFHPYKDKREGEVQVVVGADSFSISRKETLREHGLNNSWEWTASGKVTGDTLNGTFSVKENGVQTFTGTFEAKKLQ